LPFRKAPSCGAERGDGSCGEAALSGEHRRQIADAPSTGQRHRAKKMPERSGVSTPLGFGGHSGSPDSGGYPGSFCRDVPSSVHARIRRDLLAVSSLATMSQSGAAVRLWPQSTAFPLPLQAVRVRFSQSRYRFEFSRTRSRWEKSFRERNDRREGGGVVRVSSMRCFREDRS
jgi:hypothetical protein